MLTRKVLLASLLLVMLNGCQTVKIGDIFSRNDKAEAAPVVTTKQTAEKHVTMQPQQLLSALSAESKQTFSFKDETKAQQALENNYTNQPLQWQAGVGELRISPINTFKNEQGLFCREYKSTIKTEQKEVAVTSTGCRQNNGLWIRQ